MSENFDSNELEPPKLSHISLEQGKVLVGRIDSCLKQNFRGSVVLKYSHVISFLYDMHFTAHNLPACAGRIFTSK